MGPLEVVTTINRWFHFLNDHKNPKLKEMLVETRVFPHHVDFAKGGPLFSQKLFLNILSAQETGEYHPKAAG